jgi:hypothetical protein
MSDTVHLSGVADILERAAEIVEREGLHKGTLWVNCFTRVGDMFPVMQNYSGGSACTMGALMVASNELSLDSWESILGEQRGSSELRTARVTVRATLQQTQGTSRIAAWNDHPDRTATEVVDLLKTAAKDIRNG